MLVITVESGSVPGAGTRWAGRRHDDDRPDATSGSSAAELFDAVFHALHDGEQVALGLGCPLTLPVAPDQAMAPAGRAGEDEFLRMAEPASGPAIAALEHVLRELGTWRPWTTVSTSLPRWTANTSILVWEAVPPPGSGVIAASAAVESFFRQLPAAAAQRTERAALPVLNLAAAAARRAGLFVDASELGRPAVSITVTSA